MSNPNLLLPGLESPYQEALAQCAKAALEKFDVVAVLASGTIIRGTPDARSDLDLHILHRGAFRQRRQEFHNGVPCEIFVNPPSRIQSYFDEEREDRRPMTAHMFATGTLIYDPEGVGAELQVKAKLSLLDPALPNPKELEMQRYGAATMFEDALDIADKNPNAAALILASAVWSLAQCRVAAEPGWLPRPKDLFNRLQEIDPIAANLALAASNEANFKDRIEAGRRLAMSVTGFEGFFEWASEPEKVTLASS
jgi:hypothetical protein